MEILIPILIVVVLIFGFGVVAVNRVRTRRRGIDIEPPARPVARAATPAPTAVLEPEAPLVEVPEETQVEIEEALAPVEIEEEAPLEVIERPRFRDRLGKARAAFTGAFLSVRARKGITEDTWDDLEDALLSADVGLGVTTELLDGLRDRVKAKEITEPDELLDALKAEMKDRLGSADRQLLFEPRPGSPNVWLFVGVNGVGKTTTIGKVGFAQATDGRSVVMAAGDTFRAAAAEQLHTWAERAHADFVRGSEGGDPSSVIFDAIQRAAARDTDLVLADTAGRLHTKTNLMEELRKVRRVAAREPGRVTEVLLVIDATTGQNGLTQAQQFTEATEVTGVVLTKLDGSAKGGIVFAIETAMGLPVKLVGLGEGVGDLVAFDPDEFVEALFA
jgi:fused signal recognition particle receptor